MRKVALTARSPLEYVVLMSHLEGCAWHTYNTFKAQQQHDNVDNGTAMVCLTVHNPGRPQLSETVYVSQKYFHQTMRKFRYS